jgi:glucose-6-phosphate dehydrogenase assembly protein OpcA
VQIEVTPEPPDDVHEAIEAALRPLLEPEEPESAWWRAGLERNLAENVPGPL